MAVAMPSVVFRLSPDPTFTAKVQIPSAGSDDLELVVEFRRKTRDELAEFFKGFVGREEIEVLMEIVAAWHNCETPFSREALELLGQNYPLANARLIDAYSAQSTGARLGN